MKNWSNCAGFDGSHNRFIYVSSSKGTSAKENEKREESRKSDLRGTRTHTFCYPGRCPNPVRLEGPS